MAGLLDDPNQVGLLSLGLRLMSTPGKFGSALGTSGLGAMGDMQQAQAAQQMARQRAMQEQMLQMQMEEAKRAQAERQRQAERQQAIEGAYRGAIRTPDMLAMAANGGPTMAASRAAPGMSPTLDQSALIQGLMQADPMTAAQMLTPKPDELMTVAPGASVINKRNPGKPVYTAPEKAEALPGSVREFQFGQTNPQFLEWLDRQNKNKGTNIGMPKIELKMGDSTGGQVGPIVKDSKIQAEGAVKMFDAADRIEKAIASGQVMSGPLASKVMSVKQLVQVVGGGNDDSIRQTRQVIKGLAQMALESRKELQGQGQVTESEAAAAAKAEAGDLDSLTTGELKDLATLTKRAAHFRALSHQSQVNALGSMEGTRATVPFYSVRGIEPLLKHNPQLPQIGGAKSGAGFSDAEKERRYQEWKRQQGRP